MQQALEILHAIGERPLEAPEPVTGGKGGAGIWRFKSSRHGWCALRIFPQDEAGVAARETAVMVHARAIGLPVPDVHAARSINGTPIMVLEWIAGGSLDRAMLRRPWQSEELGRRAAGLMTQLHRASAPYGLGQARDWPAPIAFPAALRDRLREPDVRADALVHLDFHPLNIVLAEDGQLHLIDWTNARAGDPRFDLARSLLIFAILPGMSTVERAVARRLFEPFARAWRAAYLDAMGTPVNMPVFLAWAGYGMLAEWRFKRRRAGDDPDGEAEWETRLRGQVAGWMRDAGLESDDGEHRLKSE